MKSSSTWFKEQKVVCVVNMLKNSLKVLCIMTTHEFVVGGRMLVQVVESDIGGSYCVQKMSAVKTWPPV